MDIVGLKALYAPNIYSLNDEIILARVCLGSLRDTPTKDIEGFNDKILKYCPGIIEHKCSSGYPGGFVERLNEGTYLAHTAEHLCLEVQRMLGHDKRFGKTRAYKGDLYDVVFSCNNHAVGKACTIFVVEFINSLLYNSGFDFYNKLNELKGLFRRVVPGPSTQAVSDEAKKRGIPLSELTPGLLRLGYGKYQKYLSATIYENTSCISVDISCDKFLTKKILYDENICVPEGEVCINMKEAMDAAEKIGYPVVLKPRYGNQGKCVTTCIRDIHQLEQAFIRTKKSYEEVIVEEMIEGCDYRLLIIDGRMAAAACRVPAHVTGNGASTVRELIDIVNSDISRGVEHENVLTQIRIDEETGHMLAKQNTSLDTVPEEGVTVWLKNTANLSTGGTAEDCTDIVHEQNIRVAEAAARAIGLDIAGVDMVIPDITKPIRKGYGCIIEVNAAPGIRMHLSPSKGEKRNVAEPILDMVYPEGEPFSVPIVSVTGTNGKTTTTNMIAHIMSQMGLTTGKTTTNGIYINSICLEKGDMTGPASARKILNNRDIDIAVLETARGGILREGLGYCRADVAVLTNLAEDHLGIDGIEELEDLFFVKCLVAEAVKKNGFCVLNADDPWILKAADYTKGQVILYSNDPANKHLHEHIGKGGAAVFTDNEKVFIADSNIKEVLDVREIPATHGGLLKHNIYNSLAAIAACHALGAPSDAICKALLEFKSDIYQNPGRFNIFRINDITVVLDYGHNYNGYKFTIEGLKGLDHNRLYGVVGMPGDRRDIDIQRVGELCGLAFDGIIIKEDSDLRGRQPMETAGILYRSALAAGIPAQRIEIIPSECDALEKVLSQADRGDLIVVFYERLEPLVDIINNYRLNTNYDKKTAEVIYHHVV